MEPNSSAPHPLPPGISMGGDTYQRVVRGSKNGRLELAKQEEEWIKEVGRTVKRYRLALGVGHTGGVLLGLGE